MLKKITLGSLTMLTTVAVPIVAVVSCSQDSYNLSQLKKFSKGEITGNLHLSGGVILKSQTASSLWSIIDNASRTARSNYNSLWNELDTIIYTLINQDVFSKAERNINDAYTNSYKVAKKFKDIYDDFENLYKVEHKFRAAFDKLKNFFNDFSREYTKDINNPKGIGKAFDKSALDKFNENKIISAIEEFNKGWEYTFKASEVQDLDKKNYDLANSIASEYLAQFEIKTKFK